MIDIKQFLSAVRQIADEKGIPEDSIIDTIEAAIAAAYKRDYGKKGQIVRAKLDPQSGATIITQIHYVVEGVDDEGYITGDLPAHFLEERPEFHEPEIRRSPQEIQAEEAKEDGQLKIKFNPEKHVTLEEAQKSKSDAGVGDEIVTRLEPQTEFGRIAAQTAKQVVIQRLREAERGVVLAEFKGREGQVVSGAIQRREGGIVFVDLGRTNGLLVPAEQMPTENYRIGQRLRFVILRVEETSRGPVIVLSRAHPSLVQELFRIEVPEIDNGTVLIKGVAREPGSRTKISVASSDENVDPIGALVGQKGVRVQTVINELGGEKIDIIMWDSAIEKYIANALSPAKVMEIKVVDADSKVALAEVSDDQFSLAIGRQGQNVRLAAKLTGWKIDVRSPKENLAFEQAEPKEDSEKAEPKEETAE